MLKEVSEHLAELLQSRTFSGSPRQSELLRYLSQRLLTPGAEPPKEYAVGIDLFHKRADWDPHTDSSVRTGITRLRQKLSEFYSNEGKDSKIRLELPQGSYGLSVVVRSLDFAEPSTLESEPPVLLSESKPSTVPTVTRRQALALASGAGVVSALVAVVTDRSRHRHPQPIKIRQLTYERGDVISACFSGSNEFIYSARWAGHESQLFLSHSGSRYGVKLGFPPGHLLDRSKSGELLLSLGNAPLGTLARGLQTGGPIKQLADGVADAKWIPGKNDFGVARVESGQMLIEFPQGSPLTKQKAITPRLSLAVSPSGQRLAWFDGATGHLNIMAAERGGNPKLISKGWMLLSGMLLWLDESSVLLSGSRHGVPAVYRIGLDGSEEPLYTSVSVVGLFDRNENGQLLAGIGESKMLVSLRDMKLNSERTFPILATAIVAGVSPGGEAILLSDVLGSNGTGNLPVFALMLPGGEPVRLGEGYRPRLSPDGEYAAWVEFGTQSDRVVTSPLKTGQNRPIEIDGLRLHSVEWLPHDRSKLLLNAREHGPRIVSSILDLNTKSIAKIPKHAAHISCASSTGWAVCPDRGSLVLVNLATGTTQHVCPMSPTWRPIRWSPDGEVLYVFDTLDDHIEANIVAISTRSKKRRVVVTLKPIEGLGASLRSSVDITPDERFCAYTCQRDLSDLFVIDGLLPKPG